MATLPDLLAAHARDLMAQLAKATPGSETFEAGTPGSAPNVQGSVADAIDHQGYRRQLFDELTATLRQLRDMGWTLNDAGELVRATGISIGTVARAHL